MKPILRSLLIGGLWASVLVGSIAGGSAIWSQHYLGLGLWLNAIRALRSVMWLQVVTALVVFPSVAVAAVALGSVRVGYGALAAPMIILAAWVAFASQDLQPMLIAQLDRRFLATDLVVAAALLLFSRRLSPRRPASALLALPPLVLIAAVAAASWGLDAARARAAKAQERPNVLFLLIDALRADHVGAYGYRRPTTPAIDGLAREGALFHHVMSPSNTTHTSMPSIWTGLVPSRHGVLLGGSVFGPQFVTVAELLREAGYRTGAWCPNPSLDRVFGLSQGWDVYDDRVLDTLDESSAVPWQREETASKIHARFLSWIDSDPQRPFLAWLHYREAHTPYVPPPPYDRFFQPQALRPLTAEEQARMGNDLLLPDDGNNLEYYVARYDSEIRYANDRIAELLQEIGKRGLREKTIVIVTADHGEAFLEHGHWTHGVWLYEEAVHVPLVIVVPGSSPISVDRQVSSIDLFATILELAGIEPPPNDGFSLLPLLRGQPDAYARTQAFAEAAGKKGVSKKATVKRNKDKAERKETAADKVLSQVQASATSGLMIRAIRRGQWKLIVDERTNRRELYDLSTDPAEKVDRFAAEPEMARRLLDSLEAMVARAGSEVAPTTEIAPDLSERLRSLGYTQ